MNTSSIYHQRKPYIVSYWSYKRTHQLNAIARWKIQSGDVVPPHRSGHLTDAEKGGPAIVLNLTAGTFAPIPQILLLSREWDDWDDC